MTVISYETRTINEIENRIVAAKLSIQAAQEALIKRSLDVALNADPLADVAPERKVLDDAKELLVLLEHALEQANAAETKRLIKAQEDAAKAAQRAARQHFARGLKEAQAFSTHIQNAVSAYRRLLDAANDAAKIVPMGQGGSLWHKLS